MEYSVHMSQPPLKWHTDRLKYIRVAHCQDQQNIQTTLRQESEHV